MERKHFFKVMMPGFQQKLNLPPAVSKEIERQKSRRAILQSCLGTWKISLCKSSENGLIFLNQGWPQFVDRHALSVGDFLVFEHKIKTAEEAAEADRPKKSSMKADKQSKYFVKTMAPYFACRGAKVSIPAKFMKWNGLGQQSSAALRDPRGRAWLVTLMGPHKDGNRLRMCGGWHDFYPSNALKDGDTCVFKLKRRLLTPTTIFFDVHIKPAPLSMLP